MKFFAVALLVVLATVAVQGTPAKKKEQPKCAISCNDDYKPVCGGLPEDKSVKPKLFGNECVLDKYNCENKAHLVKVSEEQCKGAGGVRLS